MVRERAFLILLMVFCAAQVAAAPNTYTQDITYSISGYVKDSGSNAIADVSVLDGAGHITSTDGNGSYTLSGLDAGTYTLTPSKNGYTFLPTSLEVTVPPDGTDQDFTAQEINYTISGNVGVGGVVLSYFDGTSKSVVADGNGDYSLVVSYDWSGTITPSNDGYSFSPVNRDYSNILADQLNENYSANQNEYTLIVASAHGTIVKNPNQATYHEGDVVELTATPSTGWNFANWTGDLNSSINRDSVTIHGNTTVTANYTQNEYTLIITSAHGTVARNPDQATYHIGDVVQITATPSTGWSFANWTGDLIGTVNPGSVTLNGNTSVSANYTINSYLLSISKTGTGSGTVTSNTAGINCGATCSSAFNYNTAVTLTAVASTGSTFTGWGGGGCSGTGTCILSITTAATVTASFTLQTPLLTVNKTGLGNGAITSNPVGINCGSTCSHAFNYNTAVTLTATASTGSLFTGWSGGGTGTGVRTVTMTAATTITANFSDIALPNVAWVGPVGDAQVYDVYNQTIQLEVNASDNVGISRIVFYRWDYVNLFFVEIGTVSSPPYRLNFNASELLPDFNQINAEVYDTSNNLSYKHILLYHLVPQLIVNKTGSGQGKITSNLAGINCGSDCSEPYAYDQVITLTPAPFSGSTFAGWNGGGCSGTGLCTVSISVPLSVTATFSLIVSAPKLRSPQTNLLTSVNTPTFSWINVKGAQTYEIMFATDNAFTANVVSHTVNGPPYTVGQLFGDGKYYWRVRGYNESNQAGGWSTVRSFTIDTTSPLAPVPISPATNTSFSKRSPTFKWLSVPAAVSYEFQYDNDLNFSSPVYTITVRGTFRRPPAMPAGIYYWHVRAKDAVGNWGAWSVPFSITIVKP